MVALTACRLGHGNSRGQTAPEAGVDLTTFTGRPRLRTLLAPEPPGLPTAGPRATTLPLLLLALSCALLESAGVATLFPGPDARSLPLLPGSWSGADCCDCGWPGGGGGGCSGEGCGDCSAQEGWSWQVWPEQVLALLGLLSTGPLPLPV